MPLLCLESAAFARVETLSKEVRGQARRRLAVILVATQTETVTEAALLAGTSRPQVRRALNSYQVGGIDAVLAVKPGRGRRSRAIEVATKANALLGQPNPAEGRWKLEHLSTAIGVSPATLSRIRQRSNLIIPRLRQTPASHEARAEDQLILGLFLDPPLRVLVLHPAAADYEHSATLNESRNLAARGELAGRITFLEQQLRPLAHMVSCAARLARLLRASAGKSRKIRLFAQASPHPEVQRVIAAYDQAADMTPSTMLLSDWLGHCVASTAPAVASAVRTTVEYGALSRFLETEALRILRGKLNRRPWAWFVGHRSSYERPTWPSESTLASPNLDLPASVAPTPAAGEDVPF